jgi:hypothetical protein
MSDTLTNICTGKDNPMPARSRVKFGACRLSLRQQTGTAPAKLRARVKLDLAAVWVNLRRICHAQANC